MANLISNKYFRNMISNTEISEIPEKDSLRKSFLKLHDSPPFDITLHSKGSSCSSLRLIDGSFGQFAFSLKSYLFIYSFGEVRSAYNDGTMYYGNIVCMEELTEPEEWKDSYWRAYYGYVVGDTYTKEDLDSDKIRQITILTKKHMMQLARVLDSDKEAKKNIKALDDFPLSI